VGGESESHLHLPSLRSSAQDWFCEELKCHYQSYYTALALSKGLQLHCLKHHFNEINAIICLSS
jgi:hypothetical protein